MIKIQTHLVLAFMLLLNGCAMQSAFLDIEPERSIVVVETAKMKLTYSGDIHDDSYVFTKKMVSVMQLAPLNDFNATVENYVRVNTISAKSDSVAIELHEGNENTKASPINITPVRVE